MTNKQTIDGVSRELLERALRELMDWEAADEFASVKRTHDELRALLDAPTDTCAETVPKHKFDTLVQHCKRLDGEIAQARAHVNEITLYQQNAVWFWQHDGQDFLESLSCPIIIQPHQLRELLKGVIPAAQPQGEIERLLKGQIKALEACGDLSEKQRDHWMEECRKRDAQLAEAIAVLDHISGDYTGETGKRIQRCLSTSAEPKP